MTHEQEIERLKKLAADEHAEAEHYRLEASNVYLADEELREQLAELQGIIADVCRWWDGLPLKGPRLPAHDEILGIVRRARRRLK